MTTRRCRHCRYFVYDRQAGQAAHLTRWSAVNVRYWIMDRDNPGQIVDELTTKRNADAVARQLNQDAGR